MLSILATILAGAVAQTQPIFDANNDNVADVIEFFPETADLLVRNGANNNELWRSFKPACVSSPSQSHTVLFDVSGDNVLDIAVCRPKCPVAAPFLGEVELLSGANGTAIWTLGGTATMKFVGVMERVADQTVDGVPELLAAVEGDPAVRTVLINGLSGVVLDSFDLGISELMLADQAGIRLFSPGDVDRNGFINSDDLDILSDWYSGEDPRADIDGDGYATYYDLDLLVAEMNAGVVTIRGVLGTAGQNNPCTTNILCECNNTNNIPVGAGASTSNACSDAAEDVVIVLNCSNPQKPVGSFSGAPHEGPNGEPVQVRVCTTFEYLDGYGISFQLPGLLPQHASGEQMDLVAEHSGTWRVTVVVSWCVNGGWCCKKATCEFEVTQDPNTTDPCAGGSGCSYDPGDLKGLPVACPLLGGGGDGGNGTIGNPTLVLPGQVFNLWFENGAHVVDWESMCAQQQIDNPDFPGEFIHNVTTTGPIETFVTDSCSWARHMFRVLDTAQVNDNITITIDVGYSLCAMYTITLHLRVSPDNDQDMLLDCIEAMDDQCPWINDPDSDDDGMLDGEEVMLSQLHLDAGECRPVEYLFSIYDGACGGIPAFEFDHDRDGISTIYEMVISRTHPLGFDTDRDGAQDLAELELLVELPSEAHQNGRHLNPRSAADRAGSHPIIERHDADRDNLYDAYELSRGWDTTSSDQDGDGIRDGLEMIYPALLGPEAADQGPVFPGAQIDTDRDGLSDRVEDRMGTNKNRGDSDRDGVSDGAEAAMGSDPRSNDSDNDGTRDGDEDFDGDGVSNADERMYGLNLMDADTDNDGNCDNIDPDTDPNSRRRRNGNLVGSFAGTGNCETVDPRLCVHVACGNILADGSVMRTVYPGGVVEPPCDPNVDVIYAMGPGECATFTMTNTAPEFGGPTGSFGCDDSNPDCLVDLVVTGTTTWPTSFPGVTTTTICTALPAGTATADLNIDPSDLFPEMFSSSPNDPNDPNNSGLNEWDVPDGWDVYDSNGDGFADQRDSPLAIDLDIDSLNAHGFNAPEQDPNSDKYESDPSKPGKVCLATTFDSDGDNIPDYADGFDLLEDRVPGASTHTQSDGLKDLDNKSSHTFIPVKVRFRGAISPPPGTSSSSGNYHQQSLTLTYDGSDPHLVKTDLAHLFELPPTGNLRLWAYFYEQNTFQPPAPKRSVPGLVADIINGTSMFGSAEDSPQEGSPDCGAHMPDERSLEEDLDGDNDRDADDQMLAAQAGKLVGWRYVFPGQAYEPWRLGAVSWPMNGNQPGEVTMMLEVVSHSPTFAQKITAEVGAPTINGQPTVSDETNCDFDPTKTEDVFAAKDCVTATAIEKQYVPISLDGTIGTTKLPYLPMSMPVPVISINESDIHLANLEPTPFRPHELNLDISLNGHVEDALAELTGRGETLTSISILLNGEPVKKIDGSTVPLLTARPQFIPRLLPENLVKIRPYILTCDFGDDNLLQNVVVREGWNVLSFKVTNEEGVTGITEVSFKVLYQYPTEYFTINLEFGPSGNEGRVTDSILGSWRFHVSDETISSSGPVQTTYVSSETYRAATGETIETDHTAVLSQTLVDSVGFSLSGWPGLGPRFLQFATETDPNSRIFTTTTSTGRSHFTSWRQYTKWIGEGLVVRSAGPGTMNYVAEEWKGPPEMLSQVMMRLQDAEDEQHAENERISRIRQYGARYFSQQQLEGNDPEALALRATSAVLRISRGMRSPFSRAAMDRMWPPLNDPYKPTGRDEWEYTLGFGKGFLVDTPIGVLEGGWDLFQTTANMINSVGNIDEPPSKKTLSFLNNPDKVFAYERLHPKAGFSPVSDLVKWGRNVGRRTEELVQAGRTGDYVTLSKFGEEIGRAATVTIEAMESVADEVDSMPSADRGKISGRIMGETTLLVVPGSEALLFEKAGALFAVASRTNQMVRVTSLTSKMSTAERVIAEARIARIAEALQERATAIRNATNGARALRVMSDEERLAHAAQLAEEVGALYAHYRHLPEVRPWSAWEGVMQGIRQAELATSQKFPRAEILDAMKLALRDAYNEAPSLAELPTVGNVRNAMAGFLEDAEIDTHHIVFQRWLRHFIARKHGLPLDNAFVESEFLRIKDQMPAFPLSWTQHRRGRGIELPNGQIAQTMHDIESAVWGTMPNTPSRELLLEGLQTVYTQFNNIHGTRDGINYSLTVRRYAEDWLRAEELIP